MPGTLSSLTNRIFLAAALLVIVATGVTAVFVNSRVTAQAELELQRGLVESGGRRRAPGGSPRRDASRCSPG